MERTCYSDTPLNLTTRRHKPQDNMNKDLCPEYKASKNEMDQACSTYCGEDRCIQGFGRETLTNETICKTKMQMGG